MKSPRLSRAAGWSLVELLVVVTVMGFVASAMAGAMHWLSGRHQAREAALEFQSMVREASALARREMAPVRLAFLLPGSGDALERAGVGDGDDAPETGCRLLVFRVPGRHLPVQSLLAPEDDIVPALPVARTPRFSSTTGGWTAAPNRRTWTRWQKVDLGGDFVRAYTEQGFEAVTGKYQCRPETTWSEVDDGRGSQADAYSIYPEDFALSPFRDLRGIVTAVLPGDESVTLSGTGRVSAGDVFGGQEVPHWSERSGESRADRVELPAIDFMPDGGLACREDEEELEFHFGDQGKDSHWIVKIRTSDGEVWQE
ncbi:hypothetical protein OKA04_15005 [Luteolibacter flavescens]|uniref:Prepilin-type N-terminal cleavage/methylation domain-containing protein n=1 Tax=Luteolibacter flavescens TaxID=1859460 RepID=A0ABT3FST1_9BACT|nr:hypothetical protein [Luteolibacter flavescens]MCW1886045.1 hypothetical protein [Luteolibacter flavescens]